MALSSKVVNLVWPNGFDQAVESARVRHVPVVEDEAGALSMARICVLQMVDPPAIHGGGSPHDAVHLVALIEEKLGEIRTVLPGDASDQRPSWHGKSLGFRTSRLSLLTPCSRRRGVCNRSTGTTRWSRRQPPITLRPLPHDLRPAELGQDPAHPGSA